MRPSNKWNSGSNFEFVICGKYDFDYDKFPDTRKSVSVYITLLCDAVVKVKSVIQIIVELSVSEARFFGNTVYSIYALCVQNSQKHCIEHKVVNDY